MKNLIILALVVIVAGMFIWNNDTALAKVCESVNAMQEQFPVECTKARAMAILEQ